MIFARQSNEPAHNEPSFIRDFHYLTALIQHLGAHERWNSRTPRNIAEEGANKRGNSSRLTQSFHFFMFEPIFSPVNALNQPI